MSTPRDPADRHPERTDAASGDTTLMPTADRTDPRHVARDRDGDGVDDRREAAEPVVDRDGDGVDDRREAASLSSTATATAWTTVARQPTPSPTGARSPPASGRRSAA